MAGGGTPSGEDPRAARRDQASPEAWSRSRGGLETSRATTGERMRARSVP